MNLDKNSMTKTEKALLKIEGHIDVSVDRALELLGLTNKQLGIDLGKKNPRQSVNYLRSAGKLIRINPNTGKLGTVKKSVRIG